MMHANIKKELKQIENFLAFLKHQGFIIGIDQHLRVYTVLEQLEEDFQLHHLKTILCPLFAANEKQQQQFYRSFDLFFKQEKLKQSKDKTEDNILEIAVDEFQPKKWPYFLIGAILIICISLAGYHYDNLKKEPSPGTNGTKIDQPLPVPKDDIPGNEQPPNIQDDPPDKEQPIPIQPEPISSEPKGEPQPPENGNNQPSLTTNLFSFFHRNINIIKWLSVCTPFIIFILVEFYQLNRKKLAMNKQRGKKPPYIWPIIVEPSDPAFLRDQRFYLAARLMRQRLKSNIYQLDIDKTLSMTLKTGGFPNIYYRLMTKPPEYLFLIDLTSNQDHYSFFMKKISDLLQNEGVFIETYFYEKNPRICFKDVNKDRHYLYDIQKKYKQFRLIIFGDCEELIDPLSGEPEKWLSIFHVWKERAILTPIPLQNWELREYNLSKEFIILEASIDGFINLVDSFELVSKTDFNLYKNFYNQQVIPNENQIEDISFLQKYLGDEIYQWFCACAVYPELNWNLTLLFGQLSCMPDNLVTEKNLLKLIRLPWFRSGKIPDKLRWQLINGLDKEKSVAVRQSIVETLEKNPPPKETFAFDSYQLNLVVQKWMMDKKDKKQKKASKKILTYQHNQRVVQDYTILKFLDSSKVSPLSLILPKKLRNLFFRSGMPVFGFRSFTRIACTIILAIIIAFIFETFQIPKTGEDLSPLPPDDTVARKKDSQATPDVKVTRKKVDRKKDSLTTVDNDIKAGLIFKFPVYVRWPDTVWNKNTDIFNCGVIGRGPLSDILIHYDGEKILQKTIRVKRISKLEKIEDYHMLYISPSENSKLQSIFKAIEGKHILTIGDIKDFAINGGIINFVKKKDAIRYQINPEAAKRAGIEITPKLLRLAEIVKDNQLSNLNPVEKNEKDLIKPEIKLKRFNDEQKQHTVYIDEILIEGNIKGSTQVKQLWFNNEKISVSGKKNKFLYIHSLNQGINNIIIRGIDTAGSETKKTLQILYKRPLIKDYKSIMSVQLFEFKEKPVNIDLASEFKETLESIVFIKQRFQIMTEDEIDDMNRADCILKGSILKRLNYIEIHASLYLQGPDPKAKPKRLTKVDAYREHYNKKKELVVDRSLIEQMAREIHLKLAYEVPLLEGKVIETTGKNQIITDLGKETMVKKGMQFIIYEKFSGEQRRDIVQKGVAQIALLKSDISYMVLIKGDFNDIKAGDWVISR